MKRLRRALIGVTTFLGVSLFASLVLAAFYWADTTGHFRLKKIQLVGNESLEEQEILDLLELSQFSHLDEIELTALRKKVEEHPYLKASRISRDFPSTLNVDVMERSPVAYINRTPFLLLDEEAVVLPLKEDELNFDIPTLSGFNPAPELYAIGEKCLSRKVLEVVDFLNLIGREFPLLYGDISEVMINADDEYVLYLSQYPTKIYLGSSPSAPKIRILEQFTDSLRGVHTLHDFKYVDLRYEKQIIVREKV